MHEIIKQFRAALYAEMLGDFEAAKAYLLKQGSGPGDIDSYFESNWFNIADKWSNLGCRNLPTFGNNTSNRLEQFHHTIKDVLQKTKRLAEVLRNLIDIVLIRLSDRRLKQCIREAKYPLLKRFADTISPFAWGHLEEELKIMKATYNFILNENEAVRSASVSSPSGVHRLKKTRLRATGKSQYIMATNVFRSMADTMSGLAVSDSEVQLQFFINIHKLMKEGKPLPVMENEKQETENPSNYLLVDSPTVAEGTETSTARTKKVKDARGEVSLNQERLDEEQKIQRVEVVNMEQEVLQMERSVGPATVDMSEEHLSAAATYSPMRVDANQSVTDLIQTEKDDVDAEVPPIQSSESPTTNFATGTHSPMRVDADQSVTALIQNDKDDVNAEVPSIQSSENPTTNCATVTHSPMRVDADQSVTALIQNDKDDVNA
ncbi:hypothetical protein OUZ56_005278 [Daphnia magna]|uniref:Uncharacterized protein n=1 Tax=Daphnia magna TaxID=35525 RepID=A0ABQ9YSF5_9CRUS|nr:hypothetical protein OUZ56_005278 [Daphnia magna]